MANVLFGRGGGRFAGAAISLVHGLPTPNSSMRKVAAADFDGDGTPDLVALELFEIDVLKGNTDATFRGTISYTPANGFYGGRRGGGFQS
jgi:FG-GAP-like repeat